jgi:hypothetical protein
MAGGDLPPEKAARVVAAMRKLRDEKFGGVNATLAKAIGRSGAAVGDILATPPKSKPSFDTAQRVARALAIPVEQLLSDDAPPSVEPDRYPARASALGRLRGLLAPEVEEQLRTMVYPAGTKIPDEPEWIEIALRRQRLYEHDQHVEMQARTLSGRA